MTPFSACDVKGRRRTATSHIGDVAGGQSFGVSHQFRVPAGGSRFSPFLWMCVGCEAQLYPTVSAKKAARQSDLLLFPQNGGTSAIFQNLPRSAHAPETGAGSHLSGFAATVQSAGFHWLKLLSTGGAKRKCFLATIKLSLIGQPLRDSRIVISPLVVAFTLSLVKWLAEGGENLVQNEREGPTRPILGTSADWAKAVGGANEEKRRTSLAISTDLPRRERLSSQGLFCGELCCFPMGMWDCTPPFSAACLSNTSWPQY